MSYCAEAIVQLVLSGQSGSAKGSTSSGSHSIHFTWFFHWSSYLSTNCIMGHSCPYVYHPYNPSLCIFIIRGFHLRFESNIKSKLNVLLAHRGLWCSLHLFSIFSGYYVPVIPLILGSHGLFCFRTACTMESWRWDLDRRGCTSLPFSNRSRYKNIP